MLKILALLLPYCDQQHNQSLAAKSNPPGQCLDKGRLISAFVQGLSVLLERCCRRMGGSVMRASAPITRDLLLIGGGHAHALLLKMWGMSPLPGVRLTLVNPDPTAPYTGMLPGFVAGHYERDLVEIDLVKLARFAGARLILGHVEGLDLKAGRARVAGRPDMAFDIVSLDIGIASGQPRTVDGDTSLWPAKPMSRFAQGWQAHLDEVAAGTRPATAAVIGGGVGGVELAMAMHHRLSYLSPSAQVTVIEAADQILPFAPPSLRRTLAQKLKALNIGVLLGSKVDRVEEHSAHLANGQTVEAAFLASVAGALPAPWLEQTGLSLKDGFVRVGRTLCSISHDSVFAVGDCAHMDFSPRPKAGVFAVRQAPILFANLQAALSGGRMRPYRPQADYLKLISLGAKAAVAEKWGIGLSLPGLWAWKDQIDKQFLHRLSPLSTPMDPPTSTGPVALGVMALEQAQPLCGGCGSKVGPDVLNAALCDLEPPRRADIVRGRGDDAAVLLIGKAQQVLTCDHFRAFTLDPYVLAQITANHALGDIWAMGADPQAALASLILPAMSEAKQAQTVREIMAGLQSVLSSAGADMVGGHTSLGAELTVGLTLTGLMNGRAAIGLGGAKVGDRLILTKPIGVGTIMAAEMRGLAKGAWVAAALNQMLQSSGPASQLLRSQAHAMTDVTGFGLAGHLNTMLEQSNLSGQISLEAVPWCDGAIQLAKDGVHSSIYPQNSTLADRMSVDKVLRLDPRLSLMFDPQTAGGMLAAVPADKVEAVMSQMAAIGQSAWVIGSLSAAAEGHRLTVTA
jgi:selenide,water dikinase